MKFTFVHILLIVIYAAFANPAAFAQSITFDKVLPPEGKNFLHITGIVQDRQGYMWFASKKGLYRYDGYSMTYFKNNPLNPNSLGSNSLECIMIDSKGIIWIGTLGKGLDRFDPVTEVFSHFRSNLNDKTSLSSDTIFTILQDRNGAIWLGSAKGLSRLDPQTEKFIHYRHNPIDSNSISSNTVRALYEDKQGTLWIGTGSPYSGEDAGPDDGGLNKMDTRTGKIIRYRHDPTDPNSIVNNKVGAIFEDSKGNFWVGTAGDGLHTMNRTRGTFQRHSYDPAHPEKLSRPMRSKTLPHDHITFITEDRTGAIWIGTSDAGINRYDPKTNSIRYIKPSDRMGSDTIDNVVPDNTSWAAYTSREGILWISSIVGNLYRIDPFNKNFLHVLTGGYTSSFFEDSSGKLWIATSGGFVTRDNKGDIKQVFADSAEFAKVDDITRTYHDRHGDLWVGTSHGLYLFDKKKRNFIRYNHDAKDTASLSDNFILCIYEDRNANFWIGTFRALELMDRKTGRSTHFKILPVDTNRFSINMVASVLEDRQNRFWVGSFGAGGIQQLNKATGRFNGYLIGLNIYCIYEDSDGTVWVGADDGLYRYDGSSDVFSRFSDKSSPAEIEDINSITEDDQKNLWLGTTKAIIRINRARTETNYYGKNYNVNGNELSYGAYKGKNGQLYFGTTTGYYTFHPERLIINPTPPQVIFSNFRLADKIVKPGENSPLIQPLFQTEKIQLPYTKNIFSFDFVAIDYTNAQYNRYLFMLENYDNDWRQAGPDRNARYFNVPPGKYNFKVKAANSDGVWAEKQIRIVITPPWWRTGWAYSLYALVFLATLLGLYRFQRQRLIRKERERSREKELEQAKEIEKAYQELKTTQSQLIQSEKMASLGELTAGIAHEIQNPLNFVNNFSEVNKELLLELSEEIKKGHFEEVRAIAADVISNEEKINHHGKRAGAIVKGMLLHSRSSSGVKEPTDINALADEYVRLAYHGLRAKDKSFNATLKTDFDKSIGKIEVIPQEIGRVILNLVTNAFYAVDKKRNQQLDNYEPTVLISTKKIDNKVVIVVRDNGNGIPSNIVDKIFQPFFTTKPTGKGTGLGLSISYDIITKGHGGELQVNTRESEFAEFKIILPVQN